MASLPMVAAVGAPGLARWRCRAAKTLWTRPGGRPVSADKAAMRAAEVKSAEDRSAEVRTAEDRLAGLDFGESLIGGSWLGTGMTNTTANAIE